ncbi:hypothetical protein DFQ28_009798 [Apophysomyces sp. BC1034]|nr:hypothetical protein DFQ30_009508 [Apophysomyces sp. BC1015]KAG0181619.1 hypothetical protein DFQ29_007723 [Apophysomyces sp. BC1021]KAG0192224.1 hypothetical protein DFQ28_009798 [Apophysomyces sp. BC1034]
METFAPYNEENDSTSYFSLAQFDAELQQQAQFALQQEPEGWQDFDKLLPIDCNPFVYPKSTPPPHVISPQQSLLLDGRYDRTFLNPAPFTDTTLLNSTSVPPLMSTSSSFSSVSPNPCASPLTESMLPTSWTDSKYPSPKSLLFSPPLPSTSTGSNGLSLVDVSPEQFINDQSFYQSTTATSETSSFENLQNDESKCKKEKVPIERLKPQAAPTAPKTGGRQQKKTAHNAIERRYRNNINDRIAELKNAVPALLHAKLKDNRSGNKRSRSDDEDEADDGEEYLDGVAVATKLNKATILRKATEYILHLKRTEDNMRHENSLLQQLVAQMPSGHDILGRYQAQMKQRERDLHRQLMEEQQRERKEQQQQRKAANRRKARRTEDDEETASSGSDPTTPPSSSMNRIFMAIFMGMSFFSSQPLSAGPVSTEQYQNHHHASRTSGIDMNPISSAPPQPFSHKGEIPRPPVLASNSTESFLGGLFPLEDGWSTIRTAMFVICLIQLFLPVIKYWFISFKVKRVQKPRRTTTSHKRVPLGVMMSRPMASTVGTVTPGDQKCMQIYNILVNSLDDDNDAPPQSTTGLAAGLMKESARFVARHMFGYDILYDSESQRSPQEEWARVCKWIKLNEVECLGGNPEVTQLSMLHSCLKMINLVEILDEEDHEYIEQSRSRVYSTAAMQMALTIPVQSLSERFSRYFWHLAMYEASADDELMRPLVWDCRQDDAEDQMEVMLDSQAWAETLEVMRHQNGQLGHRSHGLSLSLTAPVLVPVAILSTLHLLDNLQTQFGRLIVSITGVPLTTAAASQSGADFSETAFDHVLTVTAPIQDTDNDLQRLARWLAAVGATVEALWKSDMETAEKWIAMLVQRVPRSVVAMETDDVDLVNHKSRMNQLDELVKKSMIHMLFGAMLLKKSKLQEGVDELRKSAHIRQNIKRLRWSRQQADKSLCGTDLESGAMAFAEFVVAVAGLEAWISAWHLASTIKDTKEREQCEHDAIEQVGCQSLLLRRMMRRHPSLNDLPSNQAIVDRLSRLGYFVSRQLDEIDSAYECSDEDDEEDDRSVSTDDQEVVGLDQEELPTRRASKALDILRGLA